MTPIEIFMTVLCAIALFLSVMFVVTAPAHSATARLDMSATILNLATMPVDEALDECDRRNIPCPAIRSKADPITEVQFSSAGSE